MADRIRDRITTTENAFTQPSTQPSTPSSKHDEPVVGDVEHNSAAELTIIEPEPSHVSDAYILAMDTMSSSLRHVSEISIELPSSDALAKVLVLVNTALQALEELRVVIQEQLTVT